jgi:23S rRNA (adenine1618-N6)-methyltransferase
MRAPAKVGIVVVGYLAALVVAWIATMAYIGLTPAVDRHGASGMTAFGDGLLFLAAFGVVAVPATGAGLYFLRPYPAAWRVLSVAAVVLNATGIAAVGLYFAGRDAAAGSALSQWSALAVFRILMAPLAGLALADLRRVCAAAGIQVAVVGCGGGRSGRIRRYAADVVIRRSSKERLHPRNRFRDGYDFARLIAASPALAPFVAPNAYGDVSIDYAAPAAVKALNQALLKDAYGIATWDVPPGYLCPPIPGRSDYIHHVADLADIADARSPRRTPRVLDIGTGANCIYPLIGAREYGWHFVGSEADPAALRWARHMVAANPSVADLIELRFQKSAIACFDGVTTPGERFDVSMCNPPFHESAEAAAEGTRRKWRNLGRQEASAKVLNFGGQSGELWCDGGEAGFVGRMIAESAGRPGLCRWFTTLVSKSAHLPRLFKLLERAHAHDVQTLEMTHGQKTTNILAWTFTPSR